MGRNPREVTAQCTRSQYPPRYGPSPSAEGGGTCTGRGPASSDSSCCTEKRSLAVERRPLAKLNWHTLASLQCRHATLCDLGLRLDVAIAVLVVLKGDPKFLAGDLAQLVARPHERTPAVGVQLGRL